MTTHSEADRSVALAFSADQVARLTGLTLRQLGYWDRTGFFQPQHSENSSRSPYSRIYSFKDVVGLRTISILLGQHNVSLPHLREVAKELSQHSATPWADIQLKVWKGRVQFDEPDTGKTRGVVDRQYVLLPLVSVMEDVKKEAEKLRQRDKHTIGRVSRNRYVAHNAPVVAGTRIPVRAIKSFADAGYSVAQILAEYPTLTEADITTALSPSKTAA
jgi:uncharacterized protein (DUF433 family)